MNALLMPLLGASPGLSTPPVGARPNLGAQPRQGFEDLLDTLVPSEAPDNDDTVVPFVPTQPDADLVPRARLGLWPTLPARFSPPKRGSATTSSAPAGPDDGPSGQPLTLANLPMKDEPGAPPQILGPRLGTPNVEPPPMVPELPATFDATVPPTADNAPTEPPLGLDPLAHGEPAGSFRRREQSRASSTGLDALAKLDAGPPSEDAPALDEPLADAMFEPLDEPNLPWDDLATEWQNDGSVRVDVDAELSVEVRAEQGEVDVHVEGTVEALDDLADLEADLEHALADSGQHHLGSFTRSERRDEPTPTQAQGAQADLQDVPPTDPTRPAPRGALFNGVA